MPSSRDPQRTQTLRRRSTNIVAVVGVMDEETGTFPTDAVVTCTLFTVGASPSPVTGATNLTMTYVEGTTRYKTAYHATIASTVDLPDAKYTARISWALSGAAREFNVPCVAVDG